MARFYSNENIAQPVVAELRRLGHDMLTSLEAGNANAAVPDVAVLSFAAAQRRILLSHNRRHFLRLHQERSQRHAGIIVCIFVTVTFSDWHSGFMSRPQVCLTWRTS